MEPKKIQSVEDSLRYMSWNLKEIRDIFQDILTTLKDIKDSLRENDKM